MKKYYKVDAIGDSKVFILYDYNKYKGFKYTEFAPIVEIHPVKPIKKPAKKKWRLMQAGERTMPDDEVRLLNPNFADRETEEIWFNCEDNNYEGIKLKKNDVGNYRTLRPAPKPRFINLSDDVLNRFTNNTLKEIFHDVMGYNKSTINRAIKIWMDRD